MADAEGGDEAATAAGAIEVSGLVQRQAWDEGVMPPVERVGPGLWSIPVPIPQNPLRYVLVYAFELPDGGVVIVDAGWPTDDAWEVLVAGLSEIGSSIQDVKGVIVTHIHPDHYGLAGRVQLTSGAWIGMHPADAEMIKARYESPEDLVERMRKSMGSSGVPQNQVPDLAEASMWVRQLLTIVGADVMLEDGDRPDVPGWNLRTVWTPGHSPGHICLYEEDRRLLLSGDHVLPRITPNISSHPQQPLNPLADFIESLAKVAKYDVDEVLPAHEWRFKGLAARVDELVAHHHERLGEIEDRLRKEPGLSCWELTLRLTWSRPWEEIPIYMQRAANGETLAHLVLLEADGRVVTEGDEPIRYSPAGA